MKRTLTALVLAASLTLTSAGCAWWISKLPVVIAAVQDGMIVVDGIQVFVDSWFKQKPDPVLEAKIDAAVAKARYALDAALRVAQGSDDLDQSKIDAAFAEFKQAYIDLLELVKPLGVKPEGDKLAAAPTAGGGLIVPEPLAFKITRK